MSMVKQGKVLVQIGTNDGNDAFRKVVGYSNPSKVVLVEPNESLNDKIRESYKNIKNVFIENVIITDIEGVVKIVHPKTYYTDTGKRIGKNNYIDKHFSLLPMDDWGDDFEEMEAPSMSFMDLCEKYALDHIHYLQIDTEGYDAEIIKSIDFNKVRIDMIEYEKWNFREECFSRHGEKAKLYGVNGMKYVSDLLNGLGYVQIDHRENILAIWLT